MQTVEHFEVLLDEIHDIYDQSFELLTLWAEFIHFTFVPNEGLCFNQVNGYRIYILNSIKFVSNRIIFL